MDLPPGACAVVGISPSKSEIAVYYSINNVIIVLRSDSQSDHGAYIYLNVEPSLN